MDGADQGNGAAGRDLRETFLAIRILSDDTEREALDNLKDLHNDAAILRAVADMIESGHALGAVRFLGERALSGPAMARAAREVDGDATFFDLDEAPESEATEACVPALARVEPGMLRVAVPTREGYLALELTRLQPYDGDGDGPDDEVEHTTVAYSAEGGCLRSECSIEAGVVADAFAHGLLSGHDVN